MFSFNQLHLDFKILFNVELISRPPHNRIFFLKKKKAYNSITNKTFQLLKNIVFWQSGNALHPMKVAFLM